jgi:hypothetical protein
LYDIADNATIAYRDGTANGPTHGHEHAAGYDPSAGMAMYDVAAANSNEAMYDTASGSGVGSHGGGAAVYGAASSGAGAMYTSGGDDGVQTYDVAAASNAAASGVALYDTAAAGGAGEYASAGMYDMAAPSLGTSGDLAATYDTAASSSVYSAAVTYDAAAGASMYSAAAGGAGAPAATYDTAAGSSVYSSAAGGAAAGPPVYDNGGIHRLGKHRTSGTSCFGFRAGWGCGGGGVKSDSTSFSVCELFSLLLRVFVTALVLTTFAPFMTSRHTR